MGRLTGPNRELEWKEGNWQLRGNNARLPAALYRRITGEWRDAIREDAQASRIRSDFQRRRASANQLRALRRRATIEGRPRAYFEWDGQNWKERSPLGNRKNSGRKYD